MFYKICIIVFFFIISSPNFLYGNQRSIFEQPTLTKNQKKEILEIIKDVEKRWLDRYGFLKLNPSDKEFPIDNENPCLFTAEYFYLLWRLGVLEGDLKEKYFLRVRKMIELLRLEPGLFNRYPGKNKERYERHFSRDEQIGLIILDLVFDYRLGFAKEINNYGKQNGYHYQNRTWTEEGSKREVTGALSSELRVFAEGIRNPQFIEYIRISAGEEITKLGQLFFQIALNITQNRPNQLTSGKILAYLRFETMYNKEISSNQKIKDFLGHLSQQYNSDNSFYELTKIYFKNTEHPVRRLSSYLGKEILLIDDKKTKDLSNEKLVIPYWMKSFLEFTIFKANEDLPDELYNKAGIKIDKNVDLKLVIRKFGLLKIDVKETECNFVILIDFEARIDWFKNLIVKVRHHEETSGKLEFHTKLIFQEDATGKVKAKISTKLLWIKKPYLRIIGAKVRISSLLTELIKKELGKTESTLNSKINSILGVK